MINEHLPASVRSSFQTNFSRPNIPFAKFLSFDIYHFQFEIYRLLSTFLILSRERERERLSFGVVQ